MSETGGARRPYGLQCQPERTRLAKKTRAGANRKASASAGKDPSRKVQDPPTPAQLARAGNHLHRQRLTYTRSHTLGRTHPEQVQTVSNHLASRIVEPQSSFVDGFHWILSARRHAALAVPSVISAS